jgi:GAF domain-containing protein
MVTMLEDITERKQTEETLIREKRQLESRFRHRAVLSRTKTTPVQTGEPQTPLDHIVQFLTDLLPASQGASIVFWDEQKEEFTIRSSSVMGEWAQEATERMRKKKGSTRWIIDQRKPLIVPNLMHDPFGAVTLSPDYGIQAYIGVPIMKENKVVGVLYAMDKVPREYKKEDVDFMEMLAARTSIAISRIEEFENLGDTRKMGRKRNPKT